MTTQLLTFVYIILNVLIVSLSIITLHLRWIHRTAAFDKIAFYVLGVFILYSASSLLLWYLFPLKDYCSLAFPFGLLLGPVLYMLTKGFLNKNPAQQDWVHILPFLLSLPFYYFYVFDTDFRYTHNDRYFGYLYTVTFVSLIGYGTKSLLLWSKKTQKSSPLLFLREIRVFVLFLGMWTALFLVPTGLKTDFYIDIRSTVHVVYYLLILFIGWKLYLVTYRGISISTKRGNSITKAISSHPKEVKVEHCEITATQRQEYEQGIQRFIRSKGFANPHVNRQRFIEATKIPPRHLHHFLHDRYGKNFSAFVNKLRVDYAARELSKTDFVKTIDDLGQACGFRSRASFYRNFTTELGCSPLEYRANNLTLS